MSTLRFKALEIVQSRRFKTRRFEKENVSENFGKYVFSYDKLEKELSRSTYRRLMHSIETGEKIDREVAEDVASAMKNWAMAHGATHYTHWFQPLTGASAEKHDTFFELEDGEAIEKFSASALVQQEPDASSFPSGGIRSTFEARGYTAWDPSSPAFLMRSPAGYTLCIPTIFVSYSGESLDYKSPLLNGMHQLEEAVVSVAQYFDKKVKGAYSTLGIEQEYFLVDWALYHARPDLMLTGRTVQGYGPAKGQQLEDHYFGSIPERVNTFMVEMEQEAHRLGIPLRTRHNEVAPGQFECAPNFEELNLAVDHNTLLMDVMEKVARRHNFKVLLHEKPFAGVNGSGKHSNWSIGTDTGVNLLSPGETPRENLQFLTFFVNVIRAVYEHADLLRATIASASNDHRLGANEAPPAIISVFIGHQLTHVLNELAGESVEEDDMAGGLLIEKKLQLKIPTVPEIRFDNTDRNRTSPFAFTGNKFEFRAVGSSASAAPAMIALNAAVTQQLRNFKNEVDAAIEGGEDKEQAILRTLRRLVKEARPILFEGNNYSEEWANEAQRRGLSNIKTTPEALDAYTSQKSVQLFEEAGIFTARELHARQEIRLERYSKQIQIESRTLGEMIFSHILPAANKALKQVLDVYEGQEEAGLEEAAESTREHAARISRHISEAKTLTFEMIEKRKEANKLEDVRDQALAYCYEVKPYLEKIRYHADKLELYVDDDLWPFVKYRELLFVR